MLDKANDIICHFSAELQYAVQVFLRFFFHKLRAVASH